MPFRLFALDLSRAFLCLTVKSPKLEDIGARPHTAAIAPPDGERKQASFGVPKHGGFVDLEGAGYITKFVLRCRVDAWGVSYHIL